MKCELNYFDIEGAFGGSQKWFRNFPMYRAGCAAITACESCIYFACEFRKKELYPFDTSELTKKEFISFGMHMKPYLKPRFRGITKLSIYTEGFGRYLRDVDSDLKLKGFEGDNSYEDAALFVKKQIDKGILIPYLLLKHTNAIFDEIEWHWFVLTGYEEKEEDLLVQIATFGKAMTVSLRDLWNTGYTTKGGMIEFTPNAQ